MNAQFIDLGFENHISLEIMFFGFQFNSSLPKTRSGKIMRRILRKIAAGGTIDDLGDVSTLADPSVVVALVKARDDLYAAKKC